MYTIVRKVILTNRLYLIGAVTGGIGGYLYWKYIGCLSGTCAITSNPVNSTVYFAVLGVLLFGIFKKRETQEQPSIKSEKEN